MFKFIFVFFVATALVGHAGNSVQAIIQKASEIDEDELFHYLSNEIGQLDQATLERNPELQFRRSLVAFDQGIFLNRIGVILPDAAKDVHNGFAFVLKHAEPNSMLYRAAKYYEELMQIIQREGPLGLTPILASWEMYKDSFLKKWSSDPTLSGEELRRAVFRKWKESSIQMDEFLQFVLIASGEADVILSSAKFTKISLAGVKEGSLVCKIEYKADNWDYPRTLTFNL